MSAPSGKEILEAFPKLGESRANELSELMKKALKDVDNDDAIDEVLETANTALDGHGVEAIQAEDGYKVDDYWRDTILLYVNLGETYETTICYDTEADEFFIGSWGDFVEAWEKGDDEDDKEEDAEEDEDEEDEEEGEEEEEDEDDGSEDDTSSLEEEEAQ